MSQQGTASQSVFWPEKLSERSARRCRDDDTGRCDEEEGRTLCGSWGGRGVGRLAKEQGLSLTGPDGLLKQFTTTVLETALNEEMTSTSDTTKKIKLRPIENR